MKNELKVKQSGITLIALIITIIVLLILAGVTISTLTGENGLLNKAGNAKEQMAMAEEKERLELIKATVAIDNNGEVALDKYIEELIKEGITTKEEVTDNEDGSKQIITDKGYSVNVKVDENGNPTVTVEGKADALPVRIVNVQLTTSTSSIKVDVQVLRGDGATYKYYYKTESTEYKLAHEGKDLSYTIDNLEQNVTYTIKVEAINKNGTVYKEAVGITGEIQSAVGILEFGSLEWNNGQAEVIITKNTEDALKIQYQVLDEELNVVKTYQEIASGEKITGLNLGETVQARLWDGTNGGSTASLTVTDTTVPNSATITLSSTTTDTESSITATVTQSDSQSGVDITSCKWVYNTTSGNIGTNASSYPNTFSTTPQTLTLSSTTEGTYYLHVLTVDKAGNKKETISTAIIVEIPKLEIGDTVSYTPSGTYNWTATYAGCDLNHLLDSSTSDYQITSWKVYNIDESTGNVELVPSVATTGEVYLKSYNGYNNAVKLLNDACSSLYGNTEKGITARCINIEDIESKLNYDPTTFSNDYAQYGQQYTSAYAGNEYYPNIYANELKNVINGTEKAGTLDLSEQTGFVTGKNTSSSIQPYQTAYYLSYSDFSSKLETEYLSLLLPVGEDTNYWVASRCVNVKNTFCYFGVRYVCTGRLGYINLHSSDNEYNSFSLSLFPVVSLAASLIEGDSTSGYSVK